MAGQTVYSALPPIAYEGQHIGDASQRISRIADAAVQFGRAVSVKDTEQCIVIPAPPVLDADAIVASGVATATTVVRKVAADFNGVVGAASFFATHYARNIELTLNSHADWDQTIILVNGRDHEFARLQEVFNVPNAGNVVIVGHEYFAQVEEVVIQPQTGTNGTLLVGTGVEYGPILSMLGVSIAKTAMVGAGTGYAALQAVPIAVGGIIAARTWDAVVDGQPAFVRHTAADSGLAVGTFGGSPDGTYAAPESSPLIVGGRQARWASAASANTLAWLDLG